jgi:hypothetical protein
MIPARRPMAISPVPIDTAVTVEAITESHSTPCVSCCVRSGSDVPWRKCIQSCRMTGVRKQLFLAPPRSL